MIIYNLECNKDFINYMEMKSRKDDIQNYQLKWNQHVLRTPENRIPRKALQYRPQGKRDL